MSKINIVITKTFTAWYKDNITHRDDGPATEYISGQKYWYLDGKQLTEEEFNEIKTYDKA